MPLELFYGASVGQTSAPDEISELTSVFTTDARSRFDAEVKMTDASNSGGQLASVDADRRLEN